LRVYLHRGHLKVYEDDDAVGVETPLQRALLKDV
jgi:hypothetical protein